MDKLSEEERNQWEKLMYYLVLLILHRRDEEERPELLSVVNETVKDRKRREEVSKMGRTAAQALIEEGKEMGVLQARQEDLMEFMRGKFGSIPQRIENKIQAITDIDHLKGLIRNVIHVVSIDELNIE